MSNIFKYASACALAAALVLTGCASGAPSLSDMDQTTREPASESAAEASGVAHVRVEDPDGDGSLAEADALLEDGTTALDALEAAVHDVEVADSSFGPFVQSIAGIANEGSSGWTYAVNGEMPSVSAGECVLEADDEVVWSYYRG